MTNPFKDSDGNLVRCLVALHTKIPINLLPDLTAVSINVKVMMSLD